MQIELTPEMEAILRSEMDSGRFSGPLEIVGKALDLFSSLHPVEFEDLEQVIAEGMDSAENEPTYSEAEARAYTESTLNSKFTLG